MGTGDELYDLETSIHAMYHSEPETLIARPWISSLTTRMILAAQRARKNRLEIEWPEDTVDERSEHEQAKSDSTGTR